jgi:hypothetical protein
MAKAKAKIELGDHVKHSITGFDGVVVCITKWLNGCVRLGVQPKKLTKEGKIRDVETIDEAELSIVKKAAVPPPEKDPGGPTPAAVPMGGVRR